MALRRERGRRRLVRRRDNSALVTALALLVHELACPIDARKPLRDGSGLEG